MTIELLNDNVQTVIKKAQLSATRPDGLRCSHMKTLNDWEIKTLTSTLKISLFNEIPEDWLDSSFAALPIPASYRISIIQNTV